MNICTQKNSMFKSGACVISKLFIAQIKLKYCTSRWQEQKSSPFRYIRTITVKKQNYFANLKFQKMNKNTNTMCTKIVTQIQTQQKYSPAHKYY